MRIEIFTDVVCPWCYLGLARFERALDGFEPRNEVEVVHRAFELNPDHPRERTTTALGMLTEKYGLTEEQALAAEHRVADLAAAEGLPFSVERPHGNTFDIHRLMQLAAERGLAEPVRRAVFRAHFGGGHDLFDPAQLAAVGAVEGLDPDEVGDVLAGDRYADAVRADEQDAARHGISGVPFFLIEGSLGISGAQPTPVLTAALWQAWDLTRA